MNSINGHTDGYRGGYDASMHASEYAEGRMDGFIPLPPSKKDLWACARLACWNALRFSTREVAYAPSKEVKEG